MTNLNLRFNGIVKKLMHQLDTKTNEDAGHQMQHPNKAYLDPHRAKVEWQELFQNHTQVIGLSGDLPNNNSFFTSTDLGKPMLFTRDDKGDFNAFLNVCRHRGATVETQSRGEKRLFSCPFHAWGYNHSGELIAVPHESHFGEVQRECNGLTRLPAEEKYGILFVCANPAGKIDISATLQGLDEELEYFNLGASKTHDFTCFQHAMNWKLANDTFGESYHFNTLHKNTLAETFYGNVQVCRPHGSNHALGLCMRSIDFLREQPEDTWQFRSAILPIYYIFPNVQLVITFLGPILVKIYPDGENPNHSFSRINMYIEQEKVELAMEAQMQMASINSQSGNIREEIEGRLNSFTEVIESEDYAVAQTCFNGMLANPDGHVLFGRNEPILHQYHNNFNKYLSKHLDR